MGGGGFVGTLPGELEPLGIFWGGNLVSKCGV